MATLNQPTNKVINILLIEDNPGDIHLILEASKSNPLPIVFQTIETGEEAIKYLHKENKYSTAPDPDLILLDFNLPCQNGLEILNAIKTHEQFKIIPVIVLTASGDYANIMQSYEMHANCFIIKPMKFDKFIYMIQEVCRFWTAIVTLPHAVAN